MRVTVHAPIPSPRPRAPIPSGVTALTDTADLSVLRAAAIRSRISGT